MCSTTEPHFAYITDFDACTLTVSFGNGFNCSSYGAEADLPCCRLEARIHNQGLIVFPGHFVQADTTRTSTTSYQERIRT